MTESLITLEIIEKKLFSGSGENKNREQKRDALKNSSLVEENLFALVARRFC